MFFYSTVKYISIILLLVSLLLSTEIHLKDGSVVIGNIIEINDKVIIVETESNQSSVTIPTQDLVSSSQAAVSTYHINEAGKYLKDFTRYLFSGLFATVAGNFIIVGANQSSAPEEQFLIGAGFSAMGLFITIYAYAQIYKAGAELEQVDNTVE